MIETLQVSLLCPDLSQDRSYFTATADPSASVFKPVPSFADLAKQREAVLSEVTLGQRSFPEKAVR